MQTKHSAPSRSAAGFSLIELMIAMAITLIVMSVASSLLGQSLNVRARENTRVEAVTDAQRALNMMTRDIANAGLGLTNNGIVVADSDDQQIRVRSNLNAFPPTLNTDTLQTDEDIVYSFTINSNVNPPETLITRQDVNDASVAQVANRVDALSILYFNAAGTQLAAGQESQAAKVRLTVTVNLPAVGSPNTPGYQPASQTQLSSDITLRNADLVNY